MPPARQVLLLGHHRAAMPPLPLLLLRHLGGFVLTLAAASVIVFAVLELLPGDAAQLMLGDTATPEAVAELRAQLGLDQPAWARYADWVGGWFSGRSAASIAWGTPTSELVRERLAVTLPLALIAMVLTVLLALALGLLAAAHHRRAPDLLLMTASQVGMAVPNFWFAILLVLAFAVTLPWFPAGGFPGWREDLGGGVGPALRALVLPAVALAVVQAAILARVTRSAVLDVLREDCVRTARAKGLSRGQALRRHVLRLAAVPVLTVGGLQFANLVTGTIVVENVFVLPGLGRLVFQAVANRDLVVVRDVVMVLAAMVIAVNLVVDLLAAWADPRLRRAG